MASLPLRVFVSHHHSPEEDAFTAHLIADLEAAGADVWVDTSGITSDDFVQKISEGLAGRQWLVLVMTPEAVASPWVRREVNAALNEHTAGRMLGILPLVMQPCQEQDIPMLWRTLHRYDATRDYQVAIAGLLWALGLATAPKARPAIPPERFPKRLADLGYVARSIGGVEIILPPLCDIPAGEFVRGSNPKGGEQRSDDEESPHLMVLPGFQIARFPATVAEYACYVRSGHAEPQEWEIQLRRLDHPVVNMSRNDAVGYSTWLSEQSGKHWRLPTGDEWEIAAAWDPSAQVARVYPWGDAFDTDRCNSKESGYHSTTPVGTYPNGASPCGAQDMAGNVWEWTDTERFPLAEYLLLGGSWRTTPPRSLRPTYRNFYLKSHESRNFVGFRLVLEATSS